MAKKDETADEKRERIAALLADYERTHDLVPGTAFMGRRPEGGMSWEGAARMAAARRPEDRDRRDALALARYPNPTGYVGEDQAGAEAAS